MNTEAKRVSELRALNQQARENLPDFYPRATGQYLTKCMTQTGFDKLDLDEVEALVWEGVEHLPTKDICLMIRSSVDDLERAFVHGFLIAKGEL